jgi:uncharacterized ferritin-like protein (DUF455 family)
MAVTVHEFAERIVFSTDLAAKLAPPASALRDVTTGPPIVCPAAPGRPPELRLVAGARDRADFPREFELRTDRARGRLLHFFANHELLATELMALALLRFPDAPSAFRRGLLHTLCEEQVHTQWYLERMRDYGVSFGEYPVTGFFWRAVADMPSPIDYLARLPMTFEQANLDYSLFYRDVFHRADDTASANLFQRIHDDEVNHVSYGLTWFRRFKSGTASDFDAFARRLTFPLSPARARGKPPLDIAGRRRAGLDDPFIRQLELFARSRGRTPRVHVFNPAAEFELARPDAPPDRASTALAVDLDLLPLAIARRDDVVLVRRRPASNHLSRLAAAGFDLPEFETLAPDGTLRADSLLRQRKLGGLRPWAWTPEANRLFVPLFRNVGGAERDAGWDVSQRGLFSKAFGADVLRKLGDPDSGIAVDSLDRLREALESIRSRGHRTVVLKPAFGLSGRGHRRLTEINVEAEAWVASILALQEHLVVEPWFDRVADFSVQCEFDGGGSRVMGFSALDTSDGGRFLACRACAKFPSLFPAGVARFFNDDGRGLWLAGFYRDRVLPVADQVFASCGFRGSWGIDAFVHREASGNLLLRSVVEINPRVTMGRVTFELLRIAAPARAVRFSLATLTTARARGLRSLDELAQTLEYNDPVKIETINGRPRVASGTLILNDPATAARFLGVIEVRDARRDGNESGNEPRRGRGPAG